MNDLKIFSGTANPALSPNGSPNTSACPLGEIALGQFPDGEISCKIDEDVRGRDVFLIQPTCPPVNENLMELLIMIDSCKRASAERITAVIPYFGYARQDRKDEGRVPITAKLVANLITRAGADRVLAMDLHAAQIQGFFDVPVDHLYAAPVLNEHFLHSGIDLPNVVIVSPDEGSIKRALGHAKRLGGTLAIIDKRRMSAETTVQAHIHRRPGRRQSRADVRRHDQHGRLDQRGGEDAARAWRQGDSRCRHASGPLRSGDRAAQGSEPSQLGGHRFDSADAGANVAANASAHRRAAVGRGDQADSPQ